jgi:hypothetical protein
MSELNNGEIPHPLEAIAPPAQATISDALSTIERLSVDGYKSEFTSGTMTTLYDAQTGEVGANLSYRQNDDSTLRASITLTDKGRGGNRTNYNVIITGAPGALSVEKKIHHTDLDKEYAVDRSMKRSTSGEATMLVLDSMVQAQKDTEQAAWAAELGLTKITDQELKSIISYVSDLVPTTK